MFEAFKQDTKLLKQAVCAIESQNENSLRLVLEKGIDDPKLYIHEIRNKKALKIVNPYFKGMYKKRNKLYSSFMDKYTSSIKNTKVYVGDN